MKTYSVAIKKNGYWLTNWYQYFDIQEIDWEQVESTAKINNWQGYGYYYGHNSRNLTSAKCRTVLKEFENEEKI